MGRKKRDKSRQTERNDTSPASRWDSLTPATKHVGAMILLVVLSFAFFWPLHFGSRDLVSSDTINWRASAQSVIEYEEETGRYALWATNVFGGMPAYMITYRKAVPQVDSLINALRRVIWPSSHFVFLLVGTYLLAFYLTRDTLAGLLAAVAYGFTTYIPIILIAGHNTKFVALTMAPWLLLAFVYVLRRPGPLSFLLFAVSLSVNLRAGHFQITYYILFVALIWWCSVGIAALKASDWRPFLRSTAWLIAGGLVAALMVAQPYLAQFEYKAFTIRGAGPGGGVGGMAWEYAMGWSQGIGELLTLVIADAYGGADAYWGGKPLTAGPHYLTGLVVLLAVYGVLRSRGVTTRALAVSTVLMTLFALGSNLSFVNRLMFDYFPFFDAFRVPETWLAAVALVTAILAGFGVKEMASRTDASASLRSPAAVGYLASIAVVVLILVVGRGALEFEKPGERESIVQQIARSNNLSPGDPRVARAADEISAERRSDRQDRFTDDALRTMLILLLAGGAWLLYHRGSIGRPLLQLIVILLVLVDLWGVDRRYLNESVLPRTTPGEQRIPQYAFDQYILEQGGGDTGRFRVLSLEGNPTTTARPSYYYESLSGYHGAKLRLYQDFLEELLITPQGTLGLNALRMFNTRFVISRSPIPSSRNVFDDPQTGFSVYELSGSLPRSFFVETVGIEASAQDLWDRLRSEGFDPSVTALMLEDPDLDPAPIDSGSVATAVVSEYSPRKISIDVETDAKRLLVVSEVFYPAGWKAFVDDEEVSIHQVNYLLRGVVVPPGSHRVEMRFDPASHRVGVWLAAGSTALVYAMLILLTINVWRRRPRAESGEPEKVEE